MRLEDNVTSCRGANCSVSLQKEEMVIDEGLMSGRSYRLPLQSVRSVVVERKSVVPYASATIIAAIATLILKYNALWFLASLTPDLALKLGTVGAAATAIFALPTLSRVLFVNVHVNCDGQPASFHVAFVPTKAGMRLARRFQEMSAGS